MIPCHMQQMRSFVTTSLLQRKYFLVELEVQPVFLIGIQGHTGRLNDVLFRPALPINRKPGEPAIQKTLVFFGSDIQSFIHLMDHNDPDINYRKWCLETTVEQLGTNFPTHHIVAIKPSRIVFDHVSCFDNFVVGDILGVPRHVYHYNSLPHLEKLLQTISRAIKSMDSEQLFRFLLNKFNKDEVIEVGSENAILYEKMPKDKQMMLYKWQKKLRLHKYPLTIIGFSKGCIVLNQFVYEMHYAKRLEPYNQDSSFVDLIEDMFWLDSGHPGRSNVYLTSRAPLKTLADLNINVHLHLSVYQGADRRRPYIRSQCKEFVDVLQEFEASLAVIPHVSVNTDLNAHYNVLRTFRAREKSMELCPPVLPARAPPPPPPSPPPRAPPAPAPAPPARPRPEILGMSLISPHDTPYLGLQLIQRRPLEDPATRAPTDPIEPPTEPAAQNLSSGALVPRPASSFTVLMSQASDKINWKEDAEATQALRSATYFQIEEPVVALPSSRDISAVNVYRPVKELYQPYVPRRQMAPPPRERSPTPSSSSPSPPPSPPSPRAGRSRSPVSRYNLRFRH